MTVKFSIRLNVLDTRQVFQHTHIKADWFSYRKGVDSRLIKSSLTHSKSTSNIFWIYVASLLNVYQRYQRYQHRTIALPDADTQSSYLRWWFFRVLAYCSILGVYSVLIVPYSGEWSQVSSYVMLAAATLATVALYCQMQLQPPILRQRCQLWPRMRNEEFWFGLSVYWLNTIELHIWT